METETETEIDNHLEEREFIIKNNMIFIRNELLQKTDKYLLSDYPITSEQLEIIKTFRQALRDFTKNNYIMPDKPDFYCG